MHANTVLSVDQLVESIWGEDIPRRVTAALQSCVYRLRRALDAAEPEGGERITNLASGYRLRVAPGELDLHMFRNHVELGREAAVSGQYEEAARELRASLQLWRGPALAGVPGRFAETQADTLNEARMTAIEERIDVDLALGRHVEVMEELRQLLITYPLRERLHGQLMLALYRAGRQGSALQAYHDARKVLIDELGIEPGEELQRLHQRILAADTALAATEATQPAGTDVMSDSRSVRRIETRRLFSELDALEQKQGGIIEIVGEPGMGKTRLLSDLTDEAARRDFTVLDGRCTEFEQDIPYQVFINALGRRLSAETLDELPQGPADLLRTMFAKRSDDGDTSVDVERFHLYRAVRMLLDHWAKDGMLLVLDDFHWADTRSVELVEYLIRWPGDAPLLLVLAQRTRQASTRLRGALAHGIERGTVERIELSPLTMPQAAELLGMRPEDHRFRELHRESRGNPLYLLVLASAKPNDDELPEQFTALLLGELAGLSSTESTVAAAGAVLGDQFDIEALAAVAEVTHDEIPVVLSSLTRRDLLRPVDRAPSFSFRHPVLRWLMYANADPIWRVLAHRRALAVLSGRGAPAAEQAAHIERSLVSSEPNDLRLLTRAAEEAMATAPKTAAHWLRVALRIVPGDGEAGQTRIDLLLLLARALGVAGHLTESRDLLHETLRLIPAEPRSVRASTVAFCAMMECLLTRYAEARALLATEIAAMPNEAPREIVDLITVKALVNVIDGGLPERDLINVALMYARSDNDQVAEAGALGLRGLFEAFTTEISKASETLTECAEKFDGLSDADLAANPTYLYILGWGETFLGRFADAARHLVRGISLVQRSGHTYILPILLSSVSSVYRNLGQFADAHRAATEAKEIAESINAYHVRGLALTVESLATVWLEGGDGRRAVTLADQAVTVLPPGSCGWSPAAAISAATAARMAGQPQRCITMLVNAGGGPDLPGLPRVMRPVCFEMLAAAAVSLGQSAEEWAGRAVAAVEEVPLPHLHAYALLTQAHVLQARSNIASAAKLYREAADTFAAAGMIGSQAWTLTMAAPCAAAAGQHNDASSMIMLAKELARRCGAIRVYEDAEREQHNLATQATNEDQPQSNTLLSVLTTREREIADMAGAGKTTREIAERLSLSPRTVDVHLTRIYRKLNIKSRAVLARLMGEID